MSVWLFETPRLGVRQPTADDLAAMVAVYGDADAMRYVGDGEALTAERCQEWLAVIEQRYALKGYGMAALCRRSDGVVLGFCGVVHPNLRPLGEIKYALVREHWGQGYATEAVRGMLDYIAKNFSPTQIAATVNPAHLRSQQVLSKAGMLKGSLRANTDGSFTQLFWWREPTEADLQSL